jgi:hypothetical protein
MRRRLVSVVVGICFAMVLFLVLSGSESTVSPIMMLLLFLPPLIVVLVWTRRAPAASDVAWSAGHVTSTPSATRSIVRAPATPAGVARALGRVEARELTGSLVYGIGLGFCFLILVAIGMLSGDQEGDTRDRLLQLAPWIAHPLVGLTVVAAHRAVTRARRDGADELLDSCPASQTQRTAGFLFAAVVPVLTLAVYVVGFFVAVEVRNPFVQGSLTVENAADVLAAVALGAGGVALGVALGRWVRFTLAPVVVVVAIGLLTVRINGIGDPGWNAFTLLSTAPAQQDISSMFTDRLAWSHLAWIVGLTAATATIAFARHRRDGVMAVAASVVVVMCVGAALSATRPMPAASAARIAERIAHPEAIQRCAAAGGGVDVCVYPDHARLGDQLHARLAPIVAGLGPAAEGVVARQRYGDSLAKLPPEVRRRLPGGLPQPPSNEIAVGFGGNLGDVLEVALDVALRRVGLPDVPDADDRPIPVAAQARGVVALWLSARGLDQAAAQRLATSPDASSPDPVERGRIKFDDCRVPPVAWSAQDLAAARALVARPDADVLAVVVSGWARWVDPATGTDQLLGALGLPAVGPFDVVDPKPGDAC